MTGDAAALATIVLVGSTAALSQAAGSLPSIETFGVVGVVVIVFKFLGDQSKLHEASREKDRQFMASLRASMDAQTEAVNRLREVVDDLARRIN